MRRFGDSWALAYRNGRAILLAVLLAFLLAWALVEKRRAADNPVVEVRQETAVIVDVRANDPAQTDRAGASARTLYLVQVELPEGSSTRFMVLQPPPAVGTAVPVTVITFRDGAELFSYDPLEWHMLTD